jgi:hypothetical protein
MGSSDAERPCRGRPAPPSMSRGASWAVLACAVALCAAACGSSGTKTTTATTAKAPSPLALIGKCLRTSGYTIAPESAADVHTAPKRFEFFAIWNIVNPQKRRVALALAFSRTTNGARKAAVWTRSYNAKIGRGKVHAPVVRIGTIDVLWTAEPAVGDVRDVYGCVRPNA